MDEMEMDDEVAAAMGFSSFGGTKKRKFDQASSPKAKLDASGANMTRLGVRPKIVAEEEDVGPDAVTETVEDTEATDPAGSASQSESHPPASDTKSKSNIKHKQPTATGLAAFLSRGHALPDKSPAVNATPHPLTDVPVVQADPAMSEMVSFGGAPISRAEVNTLRKGVRDGNGHTAYFLPSFVEDPWEKTKDRQ
jgi:hypothetical protein